MWIERENASNSAEVKFLDQLNIALFGARFNSETISILENWGKKLSELDAIGQQQVNILIINSECINDKSEKMDNEDISRFVRRLKISHPDLHAIALYKECFYTPRISQGDFYFVNMQLNARDLANEIVRHIIKAKLLTGDELRVAQTYCETGLQK